MKVQTTLLQAISMALLTASCHTGAPRHEQTSIYPAIPDTIQKRIKVTDSLKIRDSMEQSINAGNCPACGMG